MNRYIYIIAAIPKDPVMSLFKRLLIEDLEAKGYDMLSFRIGALIRKYDEACT